MPERERLAANLYLITWPYGGRPATTRARCDAADALFREGLPTLSITANGDVLADFR